MYMDLCRPLLASSASDHDLGVGISGPANSNGSRTMMMNTGSSGEAAAAASGASMGLFPFTNAQWKELETQAMVFKYMMHSVPVPHELLLPFITAGNNLSDTSGIRRDLHLLKFLKNGDPEPGRCKRTDGKKWRCANAVALDQKYCEKHVQRGRPRSRKLVEPASDFNSSKKPCLAQSQPNPEAAAAASVSKLGRQNGAGLDDPQFSRSAAGIANAAFGDGASSAAALLPHSHSRNVDWSEGQWRRRGDESQKLSTFSNMLPYHQQLSLNSYAQLASGQANRPKPEFELFLNPDLKKPPTRLINSTNGLMCLGLSMEHGCNEDGEISETKQPQVGNWLTQSGGPLGEALRPTNLPPAASSPATAAASDTWNNESPPLSSSSHSAVASDSTSHRSQTRSTHHTSQPKFGIQWLSQNKLPSSP